MKQEDEQDPEWESLAADWIAAVPSAETARLRATVSARRRRMILVTACEAAIILVLTGLTWMRMKRELDLFAEVWLVTLWVCAAVAVAFALWNRRGLWAASDESTTAYVKILRLRCERRRRALRFMIVFLIAEVLLVGAELWWFHALSATSLLVLTLLSVAYAIWFVVIARGTRRELQEIERFERDTDDAETGT